VTVRVAAWCVPFERAVAQPAADSRATVGESGGAGAQPRSGVSSDTIPAVSEAGVGRAVRTRHSFLSFPYVYPEPVLVN
jgi:hypothetical protein